MQYANEILTGTKASVSAETMLRMAGEDCKRRAATPVVRCLHSETMQRVCQVEVFPHDITKLRVVSQEHQSWCLSRYWSNKCHTPDEVIQVFKDVLLFRSCKFENLSKRISYSHRVISLTTTWGGILYKHNALPAAYVHTQAFFYQTIRKMS